MDENIEAFWANFEKEVGEKVLEKTMGQHFPSPKGNGSWGLLVLTPSGLRFRPTPSQNWFASIFKSAPSTVPSQSEEDLLIPFSSISRLSNPPKKFLDFLFGSPFLEIHLFYQKDGREEEARFSVDPKSGFKKKLQEFITF
ncbi:MAG: hypothetical protein NT061_09925 [Spirochaetes bacterium]|nr:hypothetical protein [Spirochaetota bacterium]